MPFNFTLPCSIKDSASRREQTPLLAIIFATLWGLFSAALEESDKVYSILVYFLIDFTPHWCINEVMEHKTTHNIDQYIGQVIRHFRTVNDITLVQMASDLGISYQQLQKYEKGTNRISAEKLFQISNILHIDIKSFFPNEGAHKPNLEEGTHITKIRQTLGKISDEKLNVILAELAGHILRLNRA